MFLSINHTTEYVYDEPVPYGLQELRLTPQSGPGQTVTHWQITMEGGQQEAQFTDQHGNAVILARFDTDLETIRVVSTGFVETEDLAGVSGLHKGFAPLWYYQRITQFTKPGPRVESLVSSLPETSESAVTQLHALSAAISQAVRYEPGHTHSGTFAEKAVEAGHGVCQDQAHVFVSAARLLGFPARYVSGYLLMDTGPDQDATHAWAEAHVEGLGWVGYDISNGISPDDRYVRIAYGLDYADAAPVSGMRYGEGDESLVVRLRVEQ